jgi:hypothetical protein
MFVGEIVNIGNSYFVYLPSVPRKQKVYPVSSTEALKILNNQESKVVECELISSTNESDEQVEYTAHIIMSLKKNKNDEENY